MLQSFSRKCPKQNLQVMLQCYRCKQRPYQQFILLLCDHLICSSCLNKFSSMKNNGYEGIKCPCGVLTYFRTVQENQRKKYIREIKGKTYEEDNDQQDEIDYAQQTGISTPLRSHNLLQNSHPQKPRQQKAHQLNSPKRQKLSRDVSCPSLKINQSKYTTTAKNISQLNTQSFSRTHTQSQRKLNVNSYHDSTPDYCRDKNMLQKSKYPLHIPKIKSSSNLQQNLQQPQTRKHIHPQIPRSPKSKPLPPQISQNQKNQQCSCNLHFQPQYIESESAISQALSDKQNAHPNLPNSQQLHPKKPPLSPHHHFQQYQSQYSEQSQQDNDNTIEQPSSRDQISKQKNQLVEQLKSEIKYLRITHNKLLDQLSRTYNKAYNTINQDYNKLQNSLKNIYLQNILIDRNQSHLDLPKIIKLRYDNYIAKNLQKLIQQIKKYGYKDTYQEDFASEIHKYIQNQNKFKYPTEINQIKEYNPHTIYQQPYNHAHTLYLNPPSKLTKNCTMNELPCIPQLQPKQSPCYQQCKKQHQYLHRIHSPFYQCGQTGHKLQKKRIKRKTNVIIQL